ncbi:MAG: hypothetical protein IJE05_04385 [Clostridia bacterium]|nr:hypothetical protein [Clostridia bacterium]
MIETLFIIDEILCIICIFALAFFCAVLPRTGIAKYFYILFGITLLPIGIKFILDGAVWYEYIWIFLFAIVGIIVGIVLIRLNKKMTKEKQKEFDQNFRAMARHGGKRKIYGNIKS